jgi:hypothetical protein
MTRPLQVYMDEDDLRRLESWAQRRGWTKSQAIRAAVRVLTRERASDPLLDASGMIEGLPADLATRLDHHLEQTFVASRPLKARQQSSSGNSRRRPARSRVRR